MSKMTKTYYWIGQMCPYGRCPNNSEQGSVMVPVCFQGNMKLCLWLSLSNTLQSPGCGTVYQDGERHREVILDLRM